MCVCACARVCVWLYCLLVISLEGPQCVLHLYVYVCVCVWLYCLLVLSFEGPQCVPDLCLYA